MRRAWQRSHSHRIGILCRRNQHLGDGNAGERESHFHNHVCGGWKLLDRGRLFGRHQLSDSKFQYPHSSRQPVHARRCTDLRHQPFLLASACDSVGARWSCPAVLSGSRRTHAPAEAPAIKPYDARLMRCFPISTRINFAANDDPECCAPIVQAQNRLFD
jgi:hypothetical protein